MAKTITLRDVAKEAKLSVATVSMVLNRSSGYERISESTAKIVNETAKKMGYRQNSSHLFGYKQRSSLIAFAIPNIDHPFTAQLIKGVGEALREAGFQMILLDFTNNTVEESILQIQQLKKGGVEGIIIHSMGREYAKNLSEIMPCVYIDEKTLLPCVWFDAQDATFRLTDHFIKQGVTDIAYIGSTDDIDTYAEREKGIMLRMLQEGILLDNQRIFRVSANSEGGKTAYEWLSGKEKMPRAVIVFTDVVTHVLMMELHRAGYRIPDDVAIASVDDVPLSSMMFPTLTCAEVPAEEMGKRAVSIMRRLLNGEAAGYCETIPVEMHVRESSIIKQKYVEKK